MLSYTEYEKKFPSDFNKTRIAKLYYEYITTEMSIEMKTTTLNWAMPICAFEAKCAAPACEAPKKKFGAKVCNQEKEVDNTMTTYNEIEASRRYLNDRVQSIFYDKRDAFAKQFNINGRLIPSTYKELIDAIKNDKYTLDTKRTSQIDSWAEDDEFYGSPIDGITFKLDNAPDCDGYDAAVKAAEKAKIAAKDVINTGSAADGLKALQDFEAWTYSPTTTTVQ
jgi:hypothetical protein